MYNKNMNVSIDVDAKPVKAKKEKTKKPIWLKIVIWFVSVIFSLLALLGGVVAFIYFKFNINVFKLFGQLKTLNATVNVQQLAPNSHTLDDMSSAKGVADLVLPNLITYSDADGYEIGKDEISSSMSGELKFTDKQIGAIIDNLIENQDEIIVEMGSKINLKDYGFKVVQIAFANIEEKTVDFNVVVKIDLAKAKNDMTGFPMNLIKGMIPDSLYISATAVVTKGDSAFEYSTEGKALRINNLSSADTESLFGAINSFIKLGSAKEFAKMIGDTFVNALIGDSANNGFAYSLKDAGATDFAFETDAGNNYFVIKI